MVLASGCYFEPACRRVAVANCLGGCRFVPRLALTGCDGRTRRGSRSGELRTPCRTRPSQSRNLVERKGTRPLEAGRCQRRCSQPGGCATQWFCSRPVAPPNARFLRQRRRHPAAPQAPRRRWPTCRMSLTQQPGGTRSHGRVTAAAVRFVEGSVKCCKAMRGMRTCEPRHMSHRVAAALAVEGASPSSVAPAQSTLRPHHSLKRVPRPSQLHSSPACYHACFARSHSPCSPCNCGQLMLLQNLPSRPQ